jgi:hypothetical protein
MIRRDLPGSLPFALIKNRFPHSSLLVACEGTLTGKTPTFDVNFDFPYLMGILIEWRFGTL